MYKIREWQMEINNRLQMSPLLQTYLKKNGVMPAPAQTQVSSAPAQTNYTVFPASDLLRAYLTGHGIAPLNTTQGYAPAAYSVNAVNKVEGVQAPGQGVWKNTLKSKLRGNEAVVMAVIPRTMNAKDLDGNALIQGNEISGNFVNDVERLSELKSLGINTLHVLPINPPGKTKAMGTAGSVYAPDDLLRIDPELVDVNPPAEARKEIEAIYQKRTGRPLVNMDKNDPDVAFAQCQYFVNKCHENGISVMLDLPSCVSVDFSLRHPELMAKEKDGVTDKTPGGWQDIRMLSPWANEEKRELNQGVLELHKQFVDMCIGLGMDGIRADVGRAKPVEFWNVMIPYSRSKDPEFGWLAETYTYEDASPQLNMPYDRPEDLLKVGFDSYYGQYHIYNQWTKADDLYKYVEENINMSNRMTDGPRSLIGSFSTHDDISPMFYGGAPWVMLTTTLQATLPQLNPYFVDGVQSGDYYLYPYEGTNNPETQTDTNECTVHKGRIDIFNKSRKPGGDHPEIGQYMTSAMQLKNNPAYKDIINKGSFVVLETDDPEVIAYARHLNGKTLLVVANRNVNFRKSANISINGLKKTQKLDNLLPAYSDKSQFQLDDNKLVADLAPARAHVFEIDTPNIEQGAKAIYRQNMTPAPAQPQGMLAA